MSRQHVTVKEFRKTLAEMPEDMELTVNTLAEEPGRVRKVCTVCDYNLWRIDASGEVSCGRCGNKPHAWALVLL